jgi:acyl-CoA thioesterase YciA
MINIKKQAPALKVRPGPNDSNARGDVFGGWLMSQIDIAASITACDVTNGSTATRAVDGLVFLQPIYTYDIVSFYTEVLTIGNTSITIKTEVYVQRMNEMNAPKLDEWIKAAEATLVFVAINKPGEKRLIAEMSKEILRGKSK